ncbi:sulfatase-like hydrolase/transferase [uncultured Cohaesibacter sp.]|uniref:sulfatase-like hydrolase/transferase n=1 Tax=uncultured Cohaesibacter sp. TaxID=1002546 RepID=UPI0037479D4B
MRPNIIFIMSDDHASRAISAYGAGLNHTPNLDRLADEGMRHDAVYVTNSICTPSRAAITDRHPQSRELRHHSRHAHRQSVAQCRQAFARWRIQNGNFRQVASGRRQAARADRL